MTSHHPLVAAAAVTVVVAGFYAAADLLVPVATAALLTFVLATPVTWLERGLGRVAAPIVTVLLVFAVLATGVWGLSRQTQDLVPELPRYRTTLARKLDQVRRLGRGGAMEELSKTLDAVQADLDEPRAREGSRVVLAEPASGPSIFGWFGPVLNVAGTAGLVVTLVLFMLVERRELRNRLIELSGYGNLAVATKVLDEAGGRVARQLLLQALSSAVYGVLLGVGIWIAGVPYALVFAVIGGLLRFIPYVGPLVGGALPVVMSVAVLDGWIRPLGVAGFVVALELFTNLVVETVLYAGAAGVSQVALLVSVAFWTWLWGPMGLLLSVPLTVCVVVLGKHVPRLEFLATLMSESEAMSPRRRLYQRLLAHDDDEALEVVEQFVASSPPRSVYDALVVPVMAMSAVDVAEGRLSADDRAALLGLIVELLPDVAARVRDAEGATASTAAQTRPRLRVFGHPAGGTVDAVAIHVLTAAVDDLPIDVEIGDRLLPADVPTRAAAGGADVILVADVSPGQAARGRYAARKVRQGTTEARLAVGRWLPDHLVDSRQLAGMQPFADHVSTSIEQTRAYLKTVVPVERLAGPSAERSATPVSTALTAATAAT